MYKACTRAGCKACMIDPMPYINMQKGQKQHEEAEEGTETIDE